MLSGLRCACWLSRSAFISKLQTRGTRSRERSESAQTYKYKLKLTPAQERVLAGILWASRRLYNTALEQRIFLWKQRGVTRTRYEQEAELKDMRAALPGLRGHP